MRWTKMLLGSLAATTFALVAAGASADPPAYSVSGSGGKVTVSANAPWHVNKEYPWKLICGSTTVKKDGFTFGGEHTASAAGKGACQVKGGVCNGGQCQNFTESVSL